MPKTVDFYFSVVSPWTYLGMPRFRAMTAKHGAKVASGSICGLA
jgi:2-hydroxychromene-2-carboxylate isomerase